MLSKLHIHTKDRAYTVSMFDRRAGASKAITKNLSGAAAASLIGRNEVTRARSNRVTLMLANGCKVWLTPTNKSRGSAFRIS